LCRKTVNIIVPVYNASRFLRRCVNSILDQTYKDIHVILVNDGSTDDSGEICDEYVGRDSRVKVIHQINSGVSSARNAGINSSEGSFIQFVDSDDYIERDMTEILVKNMADMDQMVICGYKTIYSAEGRKIVQENHCPVTGRYDMTTFLQVFGELFNKHFINSPCNKLYTADIIKRHMLRFPEDISMGEDLLFNLAFIRKSDNINLITDVPYNYAVRDDDSLTAGFKRDYFMNQKRLFTEVQTLLLQNNCYSCANKTYVEMFYCDMIMECIANLFHNNSGLSYQKRTESIREIIADDRVREMLHLYKKGNARARIAGFMMNHKLVNCMQIYYVMKRNFKKR